MQCKLPGATLIYLVICLQILISKPLTTRMLGFKFQIPDFENAYTNLKSLGKYVCILYISLGINMCESFLRFLFLKFDAHHHNKRVLILYAKLLSAERKLLLVGSCVCFFYMRKLFDFNYLGHTWLLLF